MAKPEYTDTDSTPICPHCGKELSKIERVKTGGLLSRGINIVYLCPNCKKILSIGGNTG